MTKTKSIANCTFILGLLGLVVGCIAGLHNVLAARSEKFQQGSGVILLSRINQSLRGFLRSGESLLALRRSGAHERSCRQKRRYNFMIDMFASYLRLPPPLGAGAALGAGALLAAPKLE